MVPLKYLSTFGRKLEMSLINCENNLLLKCILVANPAVNQIPEFKQNSNTNTKPYVLVVTLSTQDNVTLLKNWNLVLKEQLIGININLRRKTNQAQNRYLDFLIGPSIYGINGLYCFII